MHMADALLSPAVAGTMTVLSVSALGYSAKKITGEGLDEKKIPMMAVMGAFVFAGQMINFTIPGTGSSGHIGGGILLAALLGPFPALITLAGVLLIQCLLFADGGLLAYGCNVFNMGVCASLIGYSLIYKPLLRRGINKKNITIASVFSVIAGLQLGAFMVVFETTLSGVTKLPFAAFAAMMQPIHLAIGLAEGIITAGVLSFVHSARPELLEGVQEGTLRLRRDKKETTSMGFSMKKLLITFLVLALLLGGGISAFASANPDGLEWAIEKVTGGGELTADTKLHEQAESLINHTALLPDYAIKDGKNETVGNAVAGITGSIVTVLLAGGIGMMLHVIKKKRKSGIIEPFKK